MRIGVYGIALNEQDNVGAWRATAKGADHFLIADTGSTDRTVEYARDFGIDVAQLSIRPFRFDDAWNAALAHMPADLDACIILSLDLRLPPDWRAQIERDWPDGDDPTALYCWFQVGGPTGLRWRYPFVHSRHGYRWRFPLHELIVPDPRVTHRRIDSELTFDHPDDNRQSTPEMRERNIAMLRAAREENPHEQRLAHYLGRELMYAGCWDEAIKILTGHATSDAFPEERSESWRFIGDCMLDSMLTVDVPSGPYRMATQVAPGRREGWMALAKLYRLQHRWPECLAAAEQALTITERSWYFNHAFAWGALPYDEAGLACHFLGRHDEAIAYGKQAIEHAPDDPRLAVNLAAYRSAAGEEPGSTLTP